MKYVLKKKNVIKIYIKSFMVQISSKSKIIQANINTNNKFKIRNIKLISCYLKTFLDSTKIER
jgi:hypothetical protein